MAENLTISGFQVANERPTEEEVQEFLQLYSLMNGEQKNHISSYMQGILATRNLQKVV